MKGSSAGHGNSGPDNALRQKYIVKAVCAYAVFSLAWIFLSDLLLSAFVDVEDIKWLSTAKGILYVLVSALMLFLMMRSVPARQVQPESLAGLVFGDRLLHRWMYPFAVLVTLAMLFVRSGIGVPVSERPMLILFMFPIILSAVVGGLGPGLVATAVAALGISQFLLPPVGSPAVANAHDIFQLAFLIGNGVLVSILSQVLHRLRRQSEEDKQLKAVTLESIGDGVITTDIHNRVTFLNAEAGRILGWGPDEALGQPLATVFQVYADQAADHLGSDGPAVAAEADAVVGCPKVLRARDGRDVPITETRAKIRRDDDGALLGEVLVIRDDTARRHAEKVLRESEETYRSLFENMLNTVAHCRMIYQDGVPIDYEFLAVNPAFAGNTGLQGVVGRRIGEILPTYARDHRELLEVLGRVATTGEPIRGEFFLPALGTWYSLAVYSPGRDEFVAVGDDITERKRAEQALLEESERRRILTDNSRDGIVIIDQDYRIFEANRRFNEMIGCPVGEAKALFVWDFDDRFAEQQIWENLTGLSSGGETFETRLKRRDGSTFDVEVSVSPARWGGQQLLFCVCRDISERKRAEAERRELEQQLIQAQKMEAVGRLAGGVAHDFNNMLSVIMGHAEIALSLTAPDDPRYEDLQEIGKAAERSASLTRQLLAFARKQTVNPRVLDLNDIVASTLKMLRRLIGEGIDLHWSPGEGLWRVKIDPSQIDQMLANLAVNARDAIGGVGRVTIATANVVIRQEREGQDILPGEYAVLSVADTGAGIDPEALEHIFEPFYTTKDVGKGTGLGLSTVFGIVKQNDGFVEVRSSLNSGTVFRIYLPRCVAREAEPLAGAVPEQPPRGNETLLLVEDEPAILKLGAAILRRQGYTVLTAGAPSEAVEVFSAQPDAIRLVITDVVMPEMNGRELVEQLRGLRPDLSCLFMSGYTADAIAQHGVLDQGVRFLQKPFSVRELVDAVRQALDNE